MYLMRGTRTVGPLVPDEWIAAVPDTTGAYYPDGPGVIDAATIRVRPLPAQKSPLAWVSPWKDPVRVATTANLNATRSGNTLTAVPNGSINAAGIDGVLTLALNDRALVKDQTTGEDRGIYRITDLGSGGTPWIMERTSDFDGADKIIPGCVIPVIEGDLYKGNLFTLRTAGPIVVNTTTLTFGEPFPFFSGSAGDLLILSASGTVTTRARRLSGTIAAMAALAPVYEGDLWFVSGGANTGSLWKYGNGAWAYQRLGLPTSKRIPLSAYMSTNAALAYAGGGYFDPAEHAESGLTTVLTLEAIGVISDAAVTGTIELYNLTDLATVATLSWTGAGDLSPRRQTTAVALPGLSKLYEIRYGKAGGAPADTFAGYGANLVLDWST